VEDPEFTVEHAPDPLVTYTWTLGGDSIDVSAPFTWTIQGAEVGFYPVCLIATDSLGCFNVSCQELLIDDVMTIYVPNAFTPNGDGANDAFLPSVLGIDPTSYSLFIADRWGIPVFTSDDPTVAWDGTFNNGGELLPQDVYVWQIVARDQFSADRREFKGSVTLLK
jgi:gliding motility-associated-like protein